MGTSPASGGPQRQTGRSIRKRTFQLSRDQCCRRQQGHFPEAHWSLQRQYCQYLGRFVENWHKARRRAFASSSYSHRQPQSLQATRQLPPSSQILCHSPERKNARSSPVSKHGEKRGVVEGGSAFFAQICFGLSLRLGARHAGRTGGIIERGALSV